MWALDCICGGLLSIHLVLLFLLSNMDSEEQSDNVLHDAWSQEERQTTCQPCLSTTFPVD